MYNRMSSSEESAIKTAAFYDSTFSEVFENADIITVSGNKILLSQHK